MGVKINYIQVSFRMNKEQITRAGLKPSTSGLTCRCCTN